MSDFDKKWYVLRAVSGKENKIKEYIENEISKSKLYGDYVFQVIIPTEKVYQIRNGKKIIKERSFFPGYIFIEAVLIGEIIFELRSLTNVIGFLGAKDGTPVPLRPSEVQRMLGKVDELAETEQEMEVPYIVGESIKVIDGPFNGFNGIIEDINEEKKKLKVMVKIFGRKTPLELSYMQVDKE